MGSVLYDKSLRIIDQRTGRTAYTENITNLRMLPSNNKVAIYGDSRTNNCVTVNGLENCGYIFWGRFLSRNKVDFRKEYEFGVGGDTTFDMINRIDEVLQSPCGTVVILGGTNDRVTYTAEQTIENLDKMIKLFVAKGKVVVLYAELPRGNAAFSPAYILTTAQLIEHMKVVNWCLNQKNRYGVYVVNAWPNMADPASTTGNIKTGQSIDGLHLNTLGAYNAGSPLADVFNFLFPTYEARLPFNNSDIYNSSTNPTGTWLNTNPMLDGTTGTPAAGGSGSMATGYKGANSSGASGITRTYSKTAQGYQQVVLSGTATGSNPDLDLLRLDYAEGALTAGRKVEVVADIEVAAGSSNLLSVEAGLTMVLADTSNFHWFDGDKYDDLSLYPAVATNGVLKTDPITIPAGFTSIRLRVHCFSVSSAAVSATIIIKSLGLRYVD